MELILWRHAEAKDAGPNEADEDRALTRKGKSDAERMGKWLDSRLPESCRILVSPALRTVQTAQALGRKFKTHVSLGPGATPEHVLAAANWPMAREPVLVVGHQPTLGLIASTLLANSSQSWRIKRSGVWWIAQQKQGDPSTTFIRAVMAPDLIGKN